MKNKNIFSILILSGSSFLVGALSYAYQFIMIRFLSDVEYAEFASMIAIINILTIILGAFSFFLVKEYVQKREILPSLLVLTRRYSLICSIVLYGVFCIVAMLLQSYLKIDSYFLLTLTGTVILISGFSLYQNPFFQSQKYFRSISVYQILNPLLRISLGGLLIYMGYGVFGAVGGFILPFALLVIARYIHIRRLTGKTPIVTQQDKQLFLRDIVKQKKQILHYVVFAFITGILTNIDILVAKSIFDGTTAGTYAALSVMAKFLIFLGMSIETVYYPQLVGEDGYDPLKMIKIGGLYLLMLCASIVGLLLIGKPILNFFKDGLGEYQTALIPLLSYCAIISYINFITKTKTAFKNYFLNYILIIYIIILFIVLQNFTYSIVAMGNTLALSSLGVLCIIFISDRFIGKVE